MSDNRRTIGWAMITIGLLLFFLAIPLPFDIFRPGVTCLLIGVLILIIRKPGAGPSL